MGGLGSIPELGRPPGEGNGYPLKYSGLENSMESIVHGVTKSQTQLSNFHFPIAWKLLESKALSPCEERKRGIFLSHSRKQVSKILRILDSKSDLYQLA